LLGFELGIATNNYDESIRICPQGTPNDISTFSVRIFGNRAGINHVNISGFFEPYLFKSIVSEIFCNG
jgi:hypothetical protein